MSWIRTGGDESYTVIGKYLGSFRYNEFLDIKETSAMSIANPALKAALLVTCAAALTVGCQTTDPYTGEKKTTSTTVGALIGAGAGAAIGMISGRDAQQRRKRALVGAGVGALSGGAVGAYMDKQENELRAQMRDSGVTVTRKGEDIVLNMPGNITFRTGSADLNAQFFKVLDGVASVARKYDKTIIEIAGHTDNVGDANFNRQLSQRRASAVARYLVSKGLSESRLLTAAGGEEHPIASNSTDQGRAANRRVEVTLAPLKEG
jgi:outer membrane protein OmpA-like peptidoglycan-associated protein